MEKLSLFAIGILFVLPVAGLRAYATADDDGDVKQQRGWLGVSIRDVDSKTAKKNSLKSNEGACVSDVQEGSPAESAGLEEGDVIVDLNGRAIYDADDLGKAVRRVEPGTKVNVTAMRQGEKKTFQVTIGKMPKQRPFAFGFPGLPSPMVHMFRSNMQGLHLKELNKQLGEYFGAPEGEGVLVEEVEPKSASDKAGFKAGDVLLKLGKRSVSDLDDIRRAMDAYREDNKVEVELLRKGARKTLSLELEGAEESGGWFESFPNERMRRSLRIEFPGSHRMIRDLPEPEIEGHLRNLEESHGLKRPPQLPKFLKEV